MVKRQLDFWGHGTGGWLWWLLVGAPLGILGAFSLIRDNVLPTRFRNLYLLQFISARSYWHWYVIFGLVYVIVVMFFVAPAANRATLKRLDELNRDNAPPPPAQPVGVRAEPYVVADEMETVWAKKNDQGFIVETSESDATIRALVIPYKNQREHPSQRRVGDIDNVSSQISLESYDGESFRLTPGPAAWLSETRERLSFGRDDPTNRLVLATAALTDWSNLNAVQRQGATLGKAVREIPLEGSYWRIRVILHADSEPKPIARSDYIFERDARSVWGSSYHISGPQLIDTATWRRERVKQFIIEADGFLKRDEEEIDKTQLNQDSANWQRSTAKFISDNYGDKDKARFEQTGKSYQTAQPPSLAERLRSQRETLKQVERLRRQLESESR